MLALYGEQGSAKSTTSRILRELIDPNKSPIRSTPNDVRDLMITATHSWVVGFDNLSHIKEWLSDALCRLSTGGGFATRGLYSNDEEKIFNVQRPVLMNGITELAKRSDLVDRTISITLPTISESKRQTEDDIWKRFDKASPRILGALLSAVSAAIRNESSVNLVRKPRMADFTQWAVAAEPALDCSSGDVITALAGNQKLSSMAAIDASVIGESLLTLLEKKSGFKGSATELLKELNHIEMRNGGIRTPKGWPQRPNILSSQLKRLIPNLREANWEVVLGERDPKSRTKIIRIERITPTKKKLTAKRRKQK